MGGLLNWGPLKTYVRCVIIIRAHGTRFQDYQDPDTRTATDWVAVARAVVGRRLVFFLFYCAGGTSGTPMIVVTRAAKAGSSVSHVINGMFSSLSMA